MLNYGTGTFRRVGYAATVYEESLNEFVAQAVREKVERYGK